MKLVVTGGAGYIGSVVGSHLIAAGHEVTVVDDLSTGHRDAVPDGATFIETSVLDAAGLAPALDGADGVLHFAARSLVGESVESPELYYRTNVAGSLTLLESMVRAGVRRLVFSSTAATYGEPEVMPIREDAPAVPTNPYGASKLAVDNMIRDMSAAHGLSAVSLRYFNVAGASGRYGERHTTETHLIPIVLQAAMGSRPHVSIFGTDYPTRDGTAIRDYIHVDDLATAHLLALDAAAEGEHRIYNLGNGSGFSVRDVIAAAQATTGREIAAVEVERRAGDPAALVASSERISAELGWQPTKPAVEEMIADAWKWLQDFSR
ncbi:MAG: UDP-glucose 4-epimerase GalE [Mycobacteriales bacterium]